MADRRAGRHRSACGSVTANAAIRHSSLPATWCMAIRNRVVALGVNGGTVPRMLHVGPTQGSIAQSATCRSTVIGTVGDAVLPEAREIAQALAAAIDGRDDRVSIVRMFELIDDLDEAYPDLAYVAECAVDIVLARSVSERASC